jgi:uncharacterized protein (TIGR02391 family)
VWQLVYESDFQEVVEIEITIPLTTHVDAKEEAIRYAATQLTEQRWIDTSHDDGEWIVNADDARAALLLAVRSRPLPDWFKGKRACYVRLNKTLMDPFTTEKPGRALVIGMSWDKADPAAEAEKYEHAAIIEAVQLLHPKVVEIATKYIDRGGHLRAAVHDVYIALENHVQDKSGLKDIGASLMSTVFSASKTILKVADHPEEQVGGMNLFQGAIKFIRNQYGHKHDVEPTEQEALEWLAFASALFRLVDKSTK